MLAKRIYICLADSSAYRKYIGMESYHTLLGIAGHFWALKSGRFGHPWPGFPLENVFFQKDLQNARLNVYCKSKGETS
jgi:hypothetical protein